MSHRRRSLHLGLAWPSASAAKPIPCTSRQPAARADGTPLCTITSGRFSEQIMHRTSLTSSGFRFYAQRARLNSFDPDDADMATSAHHPSPLRDVSPLPPSSCKVGAWSETPSTDRPGPLQNSRGTAVWTSRHRRGRPRGPTRAAGTESGDHHLVTPLPAFMVGHRET